MRGDSRRGKEVSRYTDSVKPRGSSSAFKDSHPWLTGFRSEVPLERGDRIDNLVERLPQKLPRIKDLHRNYWWLLFIDPQHHNQAIEEFKRHKSNYLWKSPGFLYDRQRSPGYLQSIMELYDEYLARDPEKVGRHLTYEVYTQIHDLVTKYAPDPELMRRSNGNDREDGHAAAFFHSSIPESGPERQESFEAFEELSNRMISGRRLFQYTTKKAGEVLEEDSITVGILSKEKKGIMMRVIPNYTMQEGEQYIDAICQSFHEEIDAPNLTPHQKLEAIARFFRDTAFIHQKVDGVGRFVYGCLPIVLTAYGFCPARLPIDQSIFGGRKPIGALVEAMVIGMHNFVKDVENHPKPTRR